MSSITLNLSDIIQKQAIHNIGCIGHVSNGKSTLVAGLTGIKTQKHDKEKERNITIHLGYANSKIFYSDDDKLYFFASSNTSEFLHPDTKKPLKLIYHFSLADCPGHESYMTTMISGTSVMDSAILVESANAPIVPQPQTLEHLLAVSYINLDKILIVQNKIDLVSKREAEKNYEKIQDFIEDTKAQYSPIIPISAQLKTNISHVGKWIATQTNADISRLNELINSNFRMPIIRSFDINKPHSSIETLQGGIIGGSIQQGLLNIGDLIEIRPGILKKNDEGWTSYPLMAFVNSINTEKNKMNYAIPGGLIGIGTTLHPGFCKADKLVGQIAGKFGTLPNIFSKITFKINNIPRPGSSSFTKYNINEKIIICNHGASINASVVSQKDTEITVLTDKPIIINLNEQISIMRKINSIFKLYSVGVASKLENPANIIYELDSYPENISNTYIINDDINHIPDEISWDYNSFWNSDIKKVDIHKLHIPLPEVLPDARNTKWCNYSALMDFMVSKQSELFGSSPEIFSPSVLKLFLKEHICKDLSTEINEKDTEATIIGKFNSSKIQTSIASWATKYISCPICKSCFSYISRENRLIYKNCIDCSAKTCIT